METEVLSNDEWEELDSVMKKAEGEEKPPTKKLKKAEEKQKESIIGLPDYLTSNLKLVFVGDNPGLTSHAKQQWYSHGSNHFWPLLYESGLISEPLTHDQDYKILDHKIGLTCLCSRATSSTKELQKDEWKQGFVNLQEKLKLYQPRVICFNGKSVYEDATGQKCKTFGFQTYKVQLPNLKPILVFVMPSTSARVKSYSKEDKTKLLQSLKSYLDKLV